LCGWLPQEKDARQQGEAAPERRAFIFYSGLAHQYFADYYHISHLRRFGLSRIAARRQMNQYQVERGEPTSWNRLYIQQNN
jgi:hypothetical protein